jgi:phosphoribosylformylglycinamidine synthase
MVGLIARAERAIGAHARAAGDAVVLLGETRVELGASALWEVAFGEVVGQPPLVNLETERRLIDFLVTAADRGLLRTAHDCSQGGLGVALSEVAMGGPYQDAGFGLELDLTRYAVPLAAHELLFSESHGRAVVTCPAERADGVVALAGELGVPVQAIGRVGDRDGRLRMRLRDGEIDTPVARLREVYFAAIPKRMGD